MFPMTDLSRACPLVLAGQLDEKQAAPLVETLGVCDLQLLCCFLRQELTR